MAVYKRLVEAAIKYFVAADHYYYSLKGAKPKVPAGATFSIQQAGLGKVRAAGDWLSALEPMNGK